MSWCKSLNYKSCLFAGCAAVHESRVHLRLPHSGLNICCNPRTQHWACVRVSRRARSDSGANALTELQARGSRWRGERKKMRQKDLVTRSLLSFCWELGSYSYSPLWELHTMISCFAIKYFMNLKRLTYFWSSVIERFWKETLCKYHIRRLKCNCWSSAA